MKYQVNFDSLPPLGTVLIYHGHEILLDKADSYVRKRDGASSYILTWRSRDGEWVGTSGLRSKNIEWSKRPGGVRKLFR